MLCLPGQAHAVTPGDWRAGNIIDDVIFYNNFAMSADQIQQFLNAKVPSCDNWGTQPYAGTTRRAYSEARGVTFPLTCLKDYYENPVTHENNLEGRSIPGGAKSAAQIIMDVSHQFRINPQTLIVTLQKEQNLVLDEWPWPKQFQKATGYGCPDSAPCDSQYYGFYNQVYNAARQFRQYANSPNSYNHIPGQNNQIRFNPNAACGSSTVYIENMATASLYNYTPYQPNQAALNSLPSGTGDGCSAYGNRNFWRYFNDWFGSTKTSAKWLRQSTANGQVWLVVEGQMQDGSYARKKWKITSHDTYVAYNIQYEPAALVSEDYLSQFTDDGTLGTIATSRSYPHFQFFDSGRRFFIPGIEYCAKNMDGSPNTSTSWGFDCFNTNVVKVVPGNEFLERVPGAGAVKPLLTTFNHITYRLSGGKKLPIYDPQTLFDMGYNWSDTTMIQDINAQQPHGPLQLSHPAVVSFAGGPFLIYDNKTFKFHNAGSFETFSAWGLHKLYKAPPLSSYDVTPPTVFSPELSVWAADSNGRKYIVDDGRKIDVTAVSADMPNVTWQTTAEDLLASLPTAAYGNYTWDRQTGAVYRIEGGKKRLVPNWANFVGLGLQIPQLLPISHTTLAQVPDGDYKLADGTLFETSTGVHMVDGTGSWHVPTYPFFIDFRLDVGGRVQGQQSLNTAYPTKGELGSRVRKSNGERFLVTNGQRLAIGESMRAEWGIPTTGFTLLTDTNISRLPLTGELGRFFLHGGGVYYAQGGQKHHIQSFGTFAALGGRMDMPNVSDDFFDAIPLGSPIP